MARQHTAWVLKDTGDSPKYLAFDGEGSAELGRARWVDDPKDALRFSRKQDAHYVSMMIGVGRFTEPEEATFG
jgi:hypothetical protein